SLFTLIAGDCSDTTEEMTVDSRDSKDLSARELSEEKEQQPQSQQQFEEQTEEQMQQQQRENQTNNASDQPMETDMEQDTAETQAEQQEEGEPEADNSTTPPRSPSPELVPKLERVEQPATPPSATATPSPPPTPTPTPMAVLPKLRLNALLASDPALKPDAKELNLSEARMLGPPPQQLVKPEPEPSSLVEPLLKPARFMCLPCGIAFSSPSTLEAHQAYYCSHRNKDAEDEAGGDKLSTGSGASAAGASAGSAGTGAGKEQEPPNKVVRTGKQYACTQCSYSADKKVSLNRHMRMHQTSPAAPSLPSLPGLPGLLPGVVGLQAAANGIAAGEESSSQQIDRYCSDCDIRFNNIKTYRAHKQHYCSSRRSDGQLTPKPEAVVAAAAAVGVGAGGAASSAAGTAAGSGKHSPQSTRNKTPTPAMVAAAAAAAAAAALQVAPPQPFLALPTNPIIIVPCSLIRAASLIPGPLTSSTSGIVNPEATCFTLDNGALKPLATALNINALAGNATPTGTPTPNPLASMPPALEPDPISPIASSAPVPQESKSSAPEPKRKEAGGMRESTPLDLSLRRSPISLLLQRQRMAEEALGKENVESVGAGAGGGGGCLTPEQIVCAPSLPSSPSMSPSPKRRAVSPRSSGAGSAASMSPPALAVGVPHLLDNLPPLRSMLPADFALSESLLAKTNPELALKLAAAAAAAVAGSSSPAELASKLGFPGAAAAAAGTAGMAVGAAGASPNATSGGQPQIYVKQGVSKCKECNIVFCKYENYLAHKQHYCSARNQEQAEPGAGAAGDSKAGGSPPGGSAAPGSGGGGSAPDTTPVAYQQLICAACGIKYTSLDNLRAHQNYYCPKATPAGGAAAEAAAQQLSLPAKEKCVKCKTLHEAALPCPTPPPPPLPASACSGSGSGSGSGSNSVNKCPVCGVVSPTASLARKHMEMHGTVKAFRCSICQYKGNTLRGMRTHIRTHFDKKTSDVNEEHYMTCIFEEEPLATPAAPNVNLALELPEQLEQQQQQQHPAQIFNCDYCNYASTYKGNVLRHMKLLHPHVAISSPSISPETREQEPNAHSMPEVNLVNGEREATSFHIKSEPLEAPAATLSLMHENNNSPIGTPHSHIKAEPLDMGIDVSPPPPATPTPTLPPPMANSPLGEAMKKYCSTCDISFNYVKTYLAHKQFYCKGKLQRTESRDSPSPNPVVGVSAMPLPLPLQSPSELMLLQKNKENLQEAAI
ncbi:hypothetical protein KR222_001932, partial [Zaprionus bogoriensis]